MAISKSTLAIGAGVVGALIGGAGAGMLAHSALEWRNAAVGASGFWSAIIPIVTPLGIIVRTAAWGVAGAALGGCASGLAAQIGMESVSEKLGSFRKARADLASPPQGPRGPAAF